MSSLDTLEYENVTPYSTKLRTWLTIESTVRIWPNKSTDSIGHPHTRTDRIWIFRPFENPYSSKQISWKFSAPFRTCPYCNMHGRKIVDGSVEIIFQNFCIVLSGHGSPCDVPNQYHVRFYINRCTHLTATLRYTSVAMCPMISSLYSGLNLRLRNDCIPDHAVFWYLSGIRKITGIWLQSNLIDQPTVQDLFSTLHTNGSLFRSITLFQFVDWISVPRKSRKPRRQAIPE